MHHKITSSNQRTTACAFRSAVNSDTALVATLLGPVAVLASGVHVNIPTRIASVLFVESTRLDVLSVPHAPPPRG